MVFIIPVILWISGIEVCCEIHSIENIDISNNVYIVRSMGMTRIWATSARLIHMESNKTISDFPTINWSSSASTSNDSITKQQQEEGTSSIHSNWTIPADIPIGNYSLIISGK